MQAHWLCATLYKICAKILICRLKPILPQSISLKQGAGGDEVVDMIKQFFTTMSMLDAWKRTFIVLISTRLEATEPGHYKPISLYITFCKICAKILVCRLKPILP